MKKRNRARRQGLLASRRGALGGIFSRAQRSRKTWTFEHLEDRQYFTATPLNVDWTSLSSSTPEGQAAIALRELAWMTLQSSASAGAAAVAGANAALGMTDYHSLLRALPNDPYLSKQWHLINVGQEVGNPDYQVIFGTPGEDINVAPVWDLGITGEGVVVAIIDSGIQLDHPDLAANIHPDLRFGQGNIPDTHGTAVAGLLGAVGNNGIGGVGVAPGVQMVPVQLGGTTAAIVSAFQFAIANDIDITNNSYGPEDIRQTNGSTIDMTPEMLIALRNSVLFGRNGLGMINVWASGNGAGPGFVEGFADIGFLDSAAYDPYINSRYTIGVTGVDHDGLYANVDGTFTSYMEAGPSVLVAAPTGSYALNIADDVGSGSGIFTTDLTGDNGTNIAPFPNGFEIDSDYFDDPDYTSRFNGTSASTPIVAGVVALMLEANPNLTWRDVQEILVRSARQNAQFEFPASGGELFSTTNSWQTNQNPIFQDPDLFPIPDPENPPLVPPDPFQMVYNPTFGDDAFFGGIGIGFGSPVADPARFMNGAGYTVSQGYGVYAELFGYGHGVVDAELAVQLAQQWHQKNQNLAPELTYTTFVNQFLTDIPGAERGNRESGFFLVPGGLGGDPGFIAYWNEYFAEDDPEDPEDGPFSGDDPPDNTRGLQFVEFSVPDHQNMAIEHVELKLSIGGPAEDLDHLRFLLVSPEGTHSELNHFFVDADIPVNSSIQNFSPALTQWFNPGGSLDTDGGNFVWTFSTNRSWGERADDAIIIDPVTLEPVVPEFIFGGPDFSPVLTQGWKLVVENWSNSDFDFDAMELTWHGEPIGANTERVRGFIGLDVNGDGLFNYDRFDSFGFDLSMDGTLNQLGEFDNSLDLTQEQFVPNATVSARRVVDGIVQSDPVARFVTGHDGNFYFDLIPDEYIISVDNPDLQDRLMDDELTEEGFLQNYRQSWHITPEWFAARDYEDIDPEFYTTPRALVDENGNPLPFLIEDPFIPDEFITVPTGVSGLNFLLEPEGIPSTDVVFSGSVFTDVNGNGIQDGDDAVGAAFTVFYDANRNGQLDSGEQTEMTNSEGNFTLTVMNVNTRRVIDIAVLPPNSEWTATNPTTGSRSNLVEPGDIITGLTYGFQPPPDDGGGGGGGGGGEEDIPGNIIGLVFNDQNGNLIKDAGEQGVSGIRVFVDANENGSWDLGEIFSFTATNGSYFLANVAVGEARVDIEVALPFQLTAPVAGHIDVDLDSDETVQNVRFGVRNLATRDFGDLPNSFQTLEASGGPHHLFIPGFRLGASVDGELNGQPSSDALGDDSQGDDEDGVVVVSNGGVLTAGANTLQVTVSGVGGLLTGWVDWNDNQQFDASERLMWTENGAQVGELHLNPGTHSLTINAPFTGIESDIGARFRWGASGLSFNGGSGAGEVEDYMLPYSGFALGDYTRNGTIDQGDYTLWRATFGMAVAPGSGADGNRNGMIDLADWVLWRRANTAAGNGSSVATTSSVTTSSVAEASSSAAASTGSVFAGLGSDLASAPSSAVSKSVRASNSVLDGSTLTDNLLVLDAAWDDASSDDASSATSGHLADTFSEDDDSSDLALAAAFEGASDWRLSM